MSTSTQEKGKPVFVPKPEFVEIYASLDQAIKDSQNTDLMPWQNQAAQALVGSIKSRIALLGDTGEFVYPADFA